MNWLEVPTTNKEGKPAGNYIIHLDNVLYWREWIPEGSIGYNGEGLSVAYVDGGKGVIVDIPLYKIYVILKEFTGGGAVRAGNQEVLSSQMLSGVEKGSKKTTEVA